MRRTGRDAVLTTVVLEWTASTGCTAAVIDATACFQASLGESHMQTVKARVAYAAKVGVEGL